MNPAVECLKVLVDAGVRVRPDGDRLRYTAEKGVVTPALAEVVSKHKGEIIDLFRRGIVEVLECGAEDCRSPLLVIDNQATCRHCGLLHTFTATGWTN